MGCDADLSNFNALVYQNGKWLCTWGQEPSYEAPDELTLRVKLERDYPDGEGWEVCEDQAAGVWRASLSPTTAAAA